MRNPTPKKRARSNNRYFDRFNLSAILSNCNPSLTFSNHPTGVDCDDPIICFSFLMCISSSIVTDFKVTQEKEKGTNKLVPFKYF
jgi:hypothetical protein